MKYFVYLNDSFVLQEVHKADCVSAFHVFSRVQGLVERRLEKMKK
jgi:hypothetical protein